MRKIMMSALIALTIMSSPVYAGERLSGEERILLQATMQLSIDRHLIDGMFYYVDRIAAKVHTLYPAKAHSKIIQMGEHFILCTKFRKNDGSPVEVDFYVSRKGKGFIVFDTVVDNRAPLKKLISNGEARVVD